MTLRELYEKIPAMTCVEGCHDCCGPVAMLQEERERIGRPIGFVPGTAHCDLDACGHCTVYEDRPFLCRLMGTVVQADLPEGQRPHFMVCPRGQHPDHPLTPAEADQLFKTYMDDYGVVKLRSRQAEVLERELFRMRCRAEKAEAAPAPTADLDTQGPAGE